METQLKTLATWSKFMGFVMVIGGALNALSGLFFFIVGAIPGVIMVLMGLKLIKSGESAAQLSYQEEDGTAYYYMITNLAAYFKMNGILVIVFLVLTILSIVGIIVLGSTFAPLLHNSGLKTF